MRMTIKRLMVGILLLTGAPIATQQALGQGGQFRQAAQPAPQNARQSVVATVNGQPITEPEFNATVQQRLEQSRQQAQTQGQQLGPDDLQAARKESLDLLIDSRLVEEHAVESGPEVPEQEVKSAVEGIKQQLQAQQVSYDDFLTSRGHTEESLENRIKGSLAWQKFQQQEITPQKLQNHFQENKDRFGADSIEQVPQQQLAQSYSASLWESIVEKKKPNAEIKVIKPAAVGMATEGNERPPQQAPANQGQGGFPSR